MDPFEFDFNSFLPISYQASNWFFDLLSLNNSIAVNREFLKIPMRELQEAMGCKKAIDYVFAMDQHVLVAVCLKERKVATYRYKGNQGLCSLWTSTEGAWVDAVGSVETTDSSSLKGHWSLPYSLFVLTKENVLIKISVQPGYALTEDYRVTFYQNIEYKKILIGSKAQTHMDEKRKATDAVYLWVPRNKILQNWYLYGDGTGKLQREVRLKQPKWTEKENSSTVAYDPEALTMCVDEIENSVICADRTNHLLFECSLRTSHSEVLCGQGKPGSPEENAKTPLAFLNAPCVPLVLRPMEFIDFEQFSPFTKEMIGAGKTESRVYGGKPRMILVCDAGNHAVRKIWQFPASPQARDLANLNRIYTLLSESEIGGHEGELLNLNCGEPKALFIGPSGRLTVTTDSFVYILASQFTIKEERVLDNVDPES